VSTSMRIQYARCEPCQFGHHFDPPEAHTWMGREDVEYKGLTWPLTVEQQAANPCACRCAGGPGGCVTVQVSDEQAQKIQKIADALTERGTDQ